MKKTFKSRSKFLLIIGLALDLLNLTSSVQASGGSGTGGGGSSTATDTIKVSKCEYE